MSGPEISAFFHDLPLVVKCVIVPSAFLVVCSILRLVSNYLPSQRPPVFEGIPFIGGVLKFVQVMQLLESRQICTEQAYVTVRMPDSPYEAAPKSVRTQSTC